VLLLTLEMSGEAEKDGVGTAWLRAMAPWRLLT
jgi:hypothetical protein